MKNNKLTRAIRAQIFPKHSLALSKAFFPTLLLFAAPSAFATDHVWLGGTGDWTTSNWSNFPPPIGGSGQVTWPTAADTNILIDSENPLASIVNLNAAVSIGSLTIDQDDRLNINNGRSMTVNSGTINNNGTFSLNGSGGNTLLQLVGETTLSGNGLTILGAHSGNRIVSASGTQTLNIGEEQTLRIDGGILGGDNPSVTGTQGLIVNNLGTLKVSDGATLTMNAESINGGVIEGLGSAAKLSGTGIYNDSTLEGSLQIASERNITASGTLTNNGTLSINGNGIYYSVLRFKGDTT